VPADTARAAADVRVVPAVAAMTPVASRGAAGDPARGTAPLVATALAALVVAGFGSTVRGGRRTIPA